MYYDHSGYPSSWQRTRFQLYAVYSHDHNCFLYVHHDKNIVLSVQTLLGSKLFTWVYELIIPEYAEVTISNSAPDCWTLSATTSRPSPLTYQTHYEHIKSIDCTNINILGEISGIDRRDNTKDSPDIKKLCTWASFIGWNVMRLRDFQSVTDEILARVMMAKNLHHTSDLLDNDVFIVSSKIYEILHSHDDVEQATQALIPLLETIKNSTMINTHRFWTNDIEQWFPRHR